MHQCATCKRTDVRLYRPYGEFLRATRVYCNAHLPNTDMLDWWVPLVPAADGSVWGYTSAPSADIARWQGLPDANPGPVWAAGRWHAAG